MNRIFALCSAFAACSLLAFSPPARAQPTIVLKVGESHPLEVGSLSRIFVDDSAVIDVRPQSGSTLLIEALADGRSQLWVWNAQERRSSYLVVVKGSPPVPKAPDSGTPAPVKIDVLPDGAHCGLPKLPEAAQAFDQAKRLVDEKRMKQARAALEEVRQLEPQASIALLHLGVVHAYLGNIKIAATAYQAFVDICPDHSAAPTVRGVLADYYREHGRPR